MGGFTLIFLCAIVLKAVGSTQKCSISTADKTILLTTKSIVQEK